MSEAGPPEELAPKLWRVPVPLPKFPGAEHAGIVNGYLVGGERWALIDTGLTTEEGIAALENGLRAAGLVWRDVELVLITHYHPDHYGLSGRVRELTGAQVLLHRADVEFMFATIWGGMTWTDFFVLHGAPRIEMSQALFSGVPGFHPAAADAYLEDGKPVELGGRELTVMHTPGHAPGHCCFELDDILFTGDHVLPKITPHVGFFPGSDDDPLRSYLASLERVAAGSHRIGFPAHGDPFDDPAGRARKIVKHHEFRIKAVVDAVGKQPKTAWDVVPDVFGEDLPPAHRFAALFETLAHLVYAREGGLAGSERDGDRLLWRATP